MLHIVARLRVGLPVPGVVVAAGGRKRGGHWREGCQTEGHNTVTAAGGLITAHIGTRMGIGGVAPHILTANSRIHNGGVQMILHHRDVRGKRVGTKAVIDLGHKGHRIGPRPGKLVRWLQILRCGAVTKDPGGRLAGLAGRGGHQLVGRDKTLVAEIILV